MAETAPTPSVPPALGVEAPTGPCVTLEICRDAWTRRLQLSINDYDERGSGGGFRLAGPKFNGSSVRLVVAKLDKRDRDEIRRYLDKIPDDAG